MSVVRTDDEARFKCWVLSWVVVERNSNTQGVDWVPLSRAHHDPGLTHCSVSLQRKPIVDLPAELALTHSLSLAEYCLFWMLRLFLFCTFCCDKKYIARKIFYFTFYGENVKCLEKFWLLHWTSTHLRAILCQRSYHDSHHWQPLIGSSLQSLASHWLLSPELKLDSQKVVTILCKILNDLTHRRGHNQRKECQLMASSTQGRRLEAFAEI